MSGLYADDEHYDHLTEVKDAIEMIERILKDIDENGSMHDTPMQRALTCNNIACDSCTIRAKYSFAGIPVCTGIDRAEADELDIIDMVSDEFHSNADDDRFLAILIRAFKKALEMSLEEEASNEP